MRRRAKTELNKWVDKADKALQDYYRALMLPCFICDNVSSCVHHFVEKSKSAGLRYYPPNLIPICSSCHSKHHLAGDPHIVATIMMKKGRAWYKRLNNKRIERKNWSLDIIKIKKEYDKWTKKREQLNLTREEKGSLS